MLLDGHFRLQGAPRIPESISHTISGRRVTSHPVQREHEPVGRCPRAGRYEEQSVPGCSSADERPRRLEL